MAPQDVLVRAVQTLASGQIVVFPGDTSWLTCACALHPGAMQRLTATGNESDTNGPTQIVVAGAVDALQWVPDMPAVGQRLARRAWPGPVVLAIPRHGVAGRLQYLSPQVAQSLLSDGKLYLHSPNHDAIYQAVQLLPGPIACRFATLRRGSGADPGSWTGLPPWVDVLIAADLPAQSAPPSVVEVDGSGWRLVAAGAVGDDELRRHAGCHIVFVCTGNTCRSPLAEALCKKLLADKLACTAEDLPARGFTVRSAGLSAFPGLQASAEAVEVAREFGADLSGHRSRPLTGELLLEADHVFTMTAEHLHVLSPHELAMLGPPRLLSCEGKDVPDPIGAEPEVYRECARQILQHLQQRLPEFQLA